MDNIVFDKMACRIVLGQEMKMTKESTTYACAEFDHSCGPLAVPT